MAIFTGKPNDDKDDFTSLRSSIVTAEMSRNVAWRDRQKVNGGREADISTVLCPFDFMEW